MTTATAISWYNETYHTLLCYRLLIILMHRRSILGAKRKFYRYYAIYLGCVNGAKMLPTSFMYGPLGNDEDTLRVTMMTAAEEWLSGSWATTRPSSGWTAKAEEKS